MGTTLIKLRPEFIEAVLLEANLKPDGVVA